MKVLILPPQLQYNFHWIIVNNVGLISMFNDLVDLHEEIELILKFHPRHGRVEVFNGVFDLTRFNVQTGDNYFDLLEVVDLVIAFESSSAVIDTVLRNKPLLYVSDFYIPGDNETIYNDFVRNLHEVKLTDVSSVLKMIKNGRMHLEDFVHKELSDRLLYAKGEEAGRLLASEIRRIANINVCN